MTTREYAIKPGTYPASEIVTFLNSAFGAEETDALCRAGAKIRISVTTPWPQPKTLPKEVILDPELIPSLQALVNHPEALEARIGELSAPQILKIAGTLGIPMSSNARLDALRARLFSSLRSGVVWRAISGEAEPEPGA